MSAADISNELGGRRYGHFFMCRCPAHDDRSPSLSIRDGDSGAIIVKCFAGCETFVVVERLRAMKLWPDHNTMSAIKRPPGPRPSRSAVHRECLAAFDSSSGQSVPRLAKGLAPPTGMGPQQWRSALASLPGDSVNALHANVEGMLRARSVWNNETIALDTEEAAIGRRYFHRRYLHLPDGMANHSIRFGPSVYFGCPLNARRPALIFLLRDVFTGIPHAIQRIPLDEDGAALTNSAGRGIKMCLGPIKYTAVMLSPFSYVKTTGKLCVGEGVATVIGAMNLGYAPAWAAVSANGIANFPVVASVRRLVILADNDSDKTEDYGRRVAEACFDRWHASGRSVEILRPTRPGTDFADIVAERALRV